MRINYITNHIHFSIKFLTAVIPTDHRLTIYKIKQPNSIYIVLQRFFKKGKIQSQPKTEFLERLIK